MVNILKRMRTLQSLLDIRLGPGAAIISGDVKRIHLNFARKINDGHFGPRKFWRLYLPRLKYHNPAIPMTVERSDNQEGPATMTVFFSSASQPSNDTQAAPEGEAAAETSKTIDMKHKHESDILSEFMKMVDGKPVLATSEEEQQLQELQDQLSRSEVDRVRTRKLVEEKKRHEAILAQARASASVESA